MPGRGGAWVGAVARIGTVIRAKFSPLVSASAAQDEGVWPGKCRPIHTVGLTDPHRPRRFLAAQSPRNQPTTPSADHHPDPPPIRAVRRPQANLEAPRPSKSPPTSHSVHTPAPQILPIMAVFPSKKFRPASEVNADAAARYRSALSRRPFLYFGLPFMAIIVAGSFVLTPATAVRYEKYDRKVKQLTTDDELAVRKNPRKVDWRDEYQVSWPCFFFWKCLFGRREWGEG